MNITHLGIITSLLFFVMTYGSCYNTNPFVLYTPSTIIQNTKDAQDIINNKLPEELLHLNSGIYNQYAALSNYQNHNKKALTRYRYYLNETASALTWFLYGDKENNHDATYMLDENFIIDYKTACLNRCPRENFWNMISQNFEFLNRASLSLSETTLNTYIKLIDIDLRSRHMQLKASSDALLRTFQWYNDFFPNESLTQQHYINNICKIIKKIDQINCKIIDSKNTFDRKLFQKNRSTLQLMHCALLHHENEIGQHLIESDISNNNNNPQQSNLLISQIIHQIGCYVTENYVTQPTPEQQKIFWLAARQIINIINSHYTIWKNQYTEPDYLNMPPRTRYEFDNTLRNYAYKIQDLPEMLRLAQKQNIGLYTSEYEPIVKLAITIAKNVIPLTNPFVYYEKQRRIL